MGDVVFGAEQLRKIRERLFAGDIGRRLLEETVAQAMINELDAEIARAVTRFRESPSGSSKFP